MNRRDEQGGFTLPEVLISAILLAVVLLGGTLSATVSLNASRDVVVSGEQEARTARLVLRVVELLRTAGMSTLLATPTGQSTDGPLQDGVSYDNIGFRRAVDFTANAVVYEPAPGQPPLLLRLDPLAGVSGPGRLVYFEGAREVVLSDHVADFAVTRTGSRLDVMVTLRFNTRQGTRDVTFTRTIVVRTP